MRKMRLIPAFKLVYPCRGYYELPNACVNPRDTVLNQDFIMDTTVATYTNFSQEMSYGVEASTSTIASGPTHVQYSLDNVQPTYTV